MSYIILRHSLTQFDRNKCSRKYYGQSFKMISDSSFENNLIDNNLSELIPSTVKSYSLGTMEIIYNNIEDNDHGEYTFCKYNGVCE